MNDYVYIVKYREGHQGLFIYSHVFSTLEKAAEYCKELYEKCQKQIKKVKASGINVKDTTHTQSQYFKATATDGKIWVIEVTHEKVDSKMGFYFTREQINEAIAANDGVKTEDSVKPVPAKWPGEGY